MNSATMPGSSLITVVRRALAGEFGVLSTGERLAAALVLNRQDWLHQMGYSIAEAIARVGPEWASLIPAAASAIKREQDEELAVSEQAAQAKPFADLPDGVDLHAALETYGEAPGYRDITLHVRVALGSSDQKKMLRLHFNRQDTETIGRAVLEMHRFVWRPGRNPIDADSGETRPGWIG